MGWSRITGEEKYITPQAVRDNNNIITANGTASLEFTKEVLRALDISPEKDIEEWYNFYKLGRYEAPMPKMRIQVLKWCFARDNQTHYPRL